jgi:hypothetical protein
LDSETRRDDDALERAKDVMNARFRAVLDAHFPDDDDNADTTMLISGGGESAGPDPKRAIAGDICDPVVLRSWSDPTARRSMYQMVDSDLDPIALGIGMMESAFSLGAMYERIRAHGMTNRLEPDDGES